MKLNFQTLKSTFLLGSAILLTVSCSDDDKPTPVVPETVARNFQLAYASGSENQSQILLQGVPNVMEGTISFEDKGYNLSSSRTARIYMSSDGKYAYSLNYTEGGIQKLEFNGGDKYTKVDEIETVIPLGVKNGRFTKLSDEEASMHYIIANPKYAGANDTEYIGHEIIASIGILDLNSMKFKNINKAITVKLDENLAKEGYFINRIDSPVISNGKLYYGARAMKFNAATGKNATLDKTLTLVVDYNDLSNATVIETNHVVGTTNGYRTPALHKNEAGDIYQLVVNSNARRDKEASDAQTNIVKIKNGKYDTSYNFDLNAALGGKKTSSNGWFYVGNGIGYIPYEKIGTNEAQKGEDPQGNPTYSAEWGLARIDLNAKTAIDLEVPAGLWLVQYQTATVKDGVFYIALSPVGGNGNIYAFDVNSTSAQGKKGAAIKSGADQYYIGIY